MFFVPLVLSICLQLPCGSRGGLRFALKRREVGLVYLNLRYYRKNNCILIKRFKAKRRPPREPQGNFKQMEWGIKEFFFIFFIN